MIRDISTQITKLPLGSVSISVDELISIFETLGLTNVTARNHNVKFESIEDIKTHKTLFSGNPDIESDQIDIYFSRSSNKISPCGGSVKNIIIAKSMLLEIKNRKSFLDIYSDAVGKFNFLFFCFFFALIAASWYNKLIILPASVQILVNILACVAVVLYSLAQLWTGYAEFVRPRVFHRPAQGFLRRSADSLVIAITAAMIGAVAGVFGTWLITPAASNNKSPAPVASGPTLNDKGSEQRGDTHHAELPNQSP